MQLLADVYSLSRKFPSQESYGLTNQIQRAAVSIPSNIAEGMGRFSIRERIHFLEVSNGSLMEVMCQFEIAHLLATSQQPKWKHKKSGLLQWQG